MLSFLQHQVQASAIISIKILSTAMNDVDYNPIHLEGFKFRNTLDISIELNMSQVFFFSFFFNITMMCLFQFFQDTYLLVLAFFQKSPSVFFQC